MIDFTRAFTTAWDRMVVILFQPFDFGKWCMIAFGAFLVGLMQGGNGYMGNGLSNLSDIVNPSKHDAPKIHFSEVQAKIRDLFSGPELGIIVVVGVIALFFLIVLSLVLLWLGSRGQFIFLDNIVRNRGKFAEPWQRYARQANGFFLIYLGLGLVSCLLTIPIVVIAVVMAFPLIQHPRWPDAGEWSIYAALFVAYLVVALLTSVILFIVREFCPALMFRQGITAKVAVFEVMEVVKQNPGNFTLIVLLRIALAIGMGLFSFAVCCLCCCELLPYLGTLLVLPGLVYIRSFTLDCFAQMGPRCDVWTVDSGPTSSPTPSGPFSPPQPLL